MEQKFNLFLHYKAKDNKKERVVKMFIIHPVSVKQDV